MLDRVLIANRGEIARRIIRTCRRIGTGVVAIHSEVDADEPHVREADAAVCVGAAPAAHSYLDIERVVRAAVDTGCDAVHPGYGFLAENPSFAEAVTSAGLIFVGPSAEVIRLLGDKAAAKRHLAAAGVPVIPGDDSGDLDDAALLDAGKAIGAPLVVKAVAGGGGKGMRAVHDLDDLPDALRSARREAGAAFGDERLLIERLVTHPRHVEVQILGDAHGSVVHLGERECSIQRRHQKLLEETPSPALDGALRARMTDAAVTAARAVDYEGAGTVEFLVAGDTLDDDHPEFAFLEVNTRLQVEHPVTELVTGRDLVELQLRVASGDPLGFTQDEVTSDGHAIEVRLYAEDPVHHLPQTGRVTHAGWPDGDGVRVDSGIETGSAVTPHYDPLLAKVIVHATDRHAACARLQEALRATSVHGVTTNLALLLALADHPRFRAGDLTTGFLVDHLDGWTPPPPSEVVWLAAAAALRRHQLPAAPGDASPWATLGPVRPTGSGGWLSRLSDGTEVRTVRVETRGDDDHITLDEAEVHRVRWGAGTRPTAPQPAGPRSAAGTPSPARLHVDDTTHLVRVTVDETDRDAAAPVVWLHVDGRTDRIQLAPFARPAPHIALAGSLTLGAPMPGTVLAIEVAPGDDVAAGTTLAVVEAMKMEHPVVAPVAGRVTAVHVSAGAVVDAGTTLVELQADDADPDGRGPEPT